MSSASSSATSSNPVVHLLIKIIVWLPEVAYQNHYIVASGCLSRALYGCQIAIFDLGHKGVTGDSKDVEIVTKIPHPLLGHLFYKGFIE